MRRGKPQARGGPRPAPGTATRLFQLDTSFQSDSPHLVLEELRLINGHADSDDFLCGGAVANA